MKTRILVVDDNENNRYLMKTLLKGTGYAATLAVNGVEALKKLRSSPFDMIIADILMPNMDGFQLCRECKNDPKLKNIPFLFCTATYTDDKDEQLALTLGADRYVRKPIDPDELLQIIEAMLGTGRPVRPVRSGSAHEDQEQVLKMYNQRLVEKLEQKMLELNAQKKTLQEKNMALREILAQIEAEKAEVLKRVTANVDELVMPILRKLRRNQGNVDRRSLDLLESTLKDLASEFASKAGRGADSLTLKQIEICNMIKSGMASKEIAEELGVSLRTVETHRNRIRKKLGISGQDVNLASYLQTLQ